MNEKFVKNIFKFSTYILVFISIFIVLNLILGAIPFFENYSIFDFLFGTKWSPDAGEFGILPLLLGTFKVVVISCIIAIPLGIMTAIYLSEYASNKIKNIFKPILELLAGVPTIVYGFFAYNFINPLILHGNGSYSTLGASIALGIMLMPIVASLCEDVISSVPNGLREASIGLGFTKYEMIKNVILPSTVSGIVAACVLSISRAFGETMIVSLAAGQIANMTLNITEPSLTLTGAIMQAAGTDGSVSSPEYTVLYAMGLVIFILTFSLNILSKKIVSKYYIKYD